MSVKGHQPAIWRVRLMSPFVLLANAVSLPQRLALAGSQGCGRKVAKALSTAGGRRLNVLNADHEGSTEYQVSCLRDARASTSAKIGVFLFWTVVGGILGSSFQTLLNLAERHDILFVTLGIMIGFCTGIFAAVSDSRLAVIFAFPAILFWLIPF